MATEETGKHNAHDQQLQQRREDAPRHAQHGALVFLFEVSFDQFFKHKAIL